MKNIYVHEEYSGENEYYINDIAVIVLSNNVQFVNTIVLPVCVDWTNVYSDLPNDADGKVILLYIIS